MEIGGKTLPLSNAEAAEMLDQFLHSEPGAEKLAPHTHQQLITLRAALKKKSSKDRVR